MEQIGWPGGTPVFGVHRLLDGPDSLDSYPETAQSQ